jgi:hypothetical protein
VLAALEGIQCWLCIQKNFLIKCANALIESAFGCRWCTIEPWNIGTEEKAQIQLAFVDKGQASWIERQQICTPDKVAKGRNANACKMTAHIVSQNVQKSDNMVLIAFVLGFELLVMCGNASGAGVFFADTRHDTAFGDKKKFAEVEFFCAQDGGKDDVFASEESTIGAQPYGLTQ